MVNIKDLKQFLKVAKNHTYASSGEGDGKKLKDRGKEFEYKQGNFYYRDRYYGFNPFCGEEVVFYKHIPVWGMNYYGKVMIKSVLEENIYLFLKKVLKRVPIDKPFRGPSRFNDIDFKYINSVQGVVEKFIGEEKIFYDKELVYILDYHGGLIGN